MMNDLLDDHNLHHSQNDITNNDANNIHNVVDAAAVDVGGGVIDVGGNHDDDDDGPTLRSVALNACKRIDIGTAIMPKPLFQANLEDYDGSEELRDAAERNDEPTNYARIINEEFNAVVIEHHLKWAPLCVDAESQSDGKAATRLGRYNFDAADSMVDWAIEHDMKVKGHVLVWAATSPTSILKHMTAPELRTELKRHIFTTMGHYRGRIQVWDVVNEPLAPNGSLANNVFLEKLGPEYIELSFRYAHECDPTATLILNENKVEGLGTQKGDRFYELMKDLKAKNVPIHGVGLQAHFNAAGTGRNRPPTPRMVKQQIRRLGELGLSVNISEMDVRVSQLPANLQQIAQRQIYHDIIAAALTEPSFDGIWLWGFTDRHTWVTHFYYDDEPLIFDEDYGRKEAYYGLRDAIATLTPGGRVGGALIPLTSDFDADGNRWGHLWMKEEPVGEDTEGGALGSAVSHGDDITGDARPDWEIDEEPTDLLDGDHTKATDEAMKVVDSDDDSEAEGDEKHLSQHNLNSELPPIS